MSGRHSFKGESRLGRLLEADYHQIFGRGCIHQDSGHHHAQTYTLSEINFGGGSIRMSGLFIYFILFYFILFFYFYWLEDALSRATLRTHHQHPHSKNTPLSLPFHWHIRNLHQLLRLASVGVIWRAASSTESRLVHDQQHHDLRGESPLAFQRVQVRMLIRNFSQPTHHSATYPSHWHIIRWRYMIGVHHQSLTPWRKKTPLPLLGHDMYLDRKPAASRNGLNVSSYSQDAWFGFIYL